jgi:hypothetical protein
MINSTGGFVSEFELSDEEPPSDEEKWFEEVMEQFVLSRAYADMATWLRVAKGPNAAIMLSQARTLHMASLAQLRFLGQRAFMLWGVNIPMPKGLKEE